MTKTILTIASCLALYGCATPQQVAQIDDDKCKSYGLQFGTPAYAQCRMNMDNNRALNRAASKVAGNAGLLHCDEAGCHAF